MKMFRAVAAVVIMLIAGVVGMYLGALFNDLMGGIISGVLISGIACVIYTIDNINSP